METETREDDSKKFLKQVSIYLPITLLIGLGLAFLIVKAVFPEIKLGGIIFAVISTMLVCVIVAFVHHRQISGDRSKNKNKGEQKEKEGRC